MGQDLHLWIAPPVTGWRGLPPEPPRVLWVLDGDPRDLTPTADAGFAGAAPPGAPEPILPEGRRMGRAADFLAFLREEARPHLARHFETAEGQDVLFGSSLGGLFATWTFLTAPDAFHDYVAVSPALWWDDAMVFDLEARTAGERDDADARVARSAGSLEEPPGVPFLERFRLVSNGRAMAGRLEARAWPSLRLLLGPGGGSGGRPGGGVA